MSVMHLKCSSIPAPGGFEHVTSGMVVQHSSPQNHWGRPLWWGIIRWQ